VGRVNWVPLVGEHTCLKVAISQQLGEATGGNNSANVTPHVKDQRVRVDMTCPDGSTYTVDAWTDERGRFSGTFSLYPRRKIREPEEPVAKGQHSHSVYAFQAHILYASQIAPTDSNIVVWQKTGDDGKGLDQTLDREPQVEPTLARSAVMRRARPMKEVRH
jgi:hypothetical protein